CFASEISHLTAARCHGSFAFFSCPVDTLHRQQSRMVPKVNRSRTVKGSECPAIMLSTPIKFESNQRSSIPRSPFELSAKCRWRRSNVFGPVAMFTRSWRDGAMGICRHANGNRNMSGWTTTANEITSDGTWNYTYDNEGNRTKMVNIGSGVTWK